MYYIHVRIKFVNKKEIGNESPNILMLNNNINAILRTTEEHSEVNRKNNQRHFNKSDSN